MRRRLAKVISVTAVTALSGLGLAACGDNGTSPELTEPVPSPAQVETVTETATETPASQTPATANGAGQASGEQPCSVSGYTDKARAELAEEGVSEAEVEEVIAQTCAGQGERDWDDSGHFELEYQGIDVDVLPDGTVIDVDRS